MCIVRCFLRTNSLFVLRRFYEPNTITRLVVEKLPIMACFCHPGHWSSYGAHYPYAQYYAKSSSHSPSYRGIRTLCLSLSFYWESLGKARRCPRELFRTGDQRSFPGISFSLPTQLLQLSCL